MKSILFALLTLASAALAAEPSTPSPQPDIPALATSTTDLSDPAYLLDIANVHLKHDSVQRARPFLRRALELSKDAGQRDSILQSLKPVFQRNNNWKDAIELYQDFCNGPAACESENPTPMRSDLKFR